MTAFDIITAGLVYGLAASAFVIGAGLPWMALGAVLRLLGWGPHHG